MSSKIIFYALACFCLIAVAVCRPQNTIDSQVSSGTVIKGVDTSINFQFRGIQDTSEQDSSPEIRRLYNAYNSYPGSNPMSPEERMALNRMQYEMMANYVQNS